MTASRVANKKGCSTSPLLKVLEKGKYFVRSINQSNSNKKIYLSTEFLTLSSIFKNQKRDGTLFEENVSKIFARNPEYKVHNNGASIRNTQGDGGIDMFITNKKKNETYIVQCKNYSSTIGPREIREFAGILKEAKNSHIKKGFYVTSSKFSKGAIRYTEEFNEESHGKTISLLDYEWYRKNTPFTNLQ